MEEEIRTIEEDVTVLGVTSVNGLTGDVPLKTVNGQEVTGEGNIEISGGEGDVKSVNSITPDENGNVTLTASDVGAATTSDIETAVATKQDTLSSTQMDAVNSGIDSNKTGQITTNTNAISDINGKIPSAATTTNQLADKDFVNNQVSTNTANYISDNGEPFESVAALEAYTGTVTNNDYAFVEVIESGNTYYDRYKATVTGSTVTWAKEYRINNSSFTSGQWDAINSGITSSGVAKLVDFTGTDGTAAGSTGLVPAPTAGDAGKVLGASGNWETPSSGPTVVQTTGTSTTDVMSQNATTKMIFADGSAQKKIAIGSGATTTQNDTVAIGTNANTNGTNAYGCVAIGAGAKAPGRGAIAIGDGANATAQGQFDISTTNTYRGYNSSNYRLLTGLYDPQNAHDAANKEYVDAISIRSAGAPTTSTTGAVGQLYQDTTNGKLYQCTAANTSSTPAVYTWQEIGGGGGAITYLSQDDYNWNWNTLTTTDPNAIAVWLLEPGLYALRSNDPSDNVINVSTGTGGGVEGSNDTVYMVTSFPLYNGTYGDYEIKTVTSLRAYTLAQNMYDYNDTVEDGWANRGQELFASMSSVSNEINNRIRSETYAPTEDDYGNVGTMWIMTDPSDTQVAKIYICTESYWDDVQGKLVNTWVEVAAHSS